MKKLEDKKREMDEQMKIDKIDLERQKAILEYQARERKIKELEQEEKRRQSGYSVINNQNRILD